MGNVHCCQKQQLVDLENGQIIINNDKIEPNNTIKEPEIIVEQKEIQKINIVNQSDSQRYTKNSSKQHLTLQEEPLQNQYRYKNSKEPNLTSNNDSLNDLGVRFSFQTINSQQKLNEFTNFVTFQAIPSGHTINTQFLKMQQQYQNEMSQLSQIQKKSKLNIDKQKYL